MSIVAWLKKNWVGILIGVAVYYFLAAFAILALILSIFSNKIGGYIAFGLLGGYLWSKIRGRK